MVFVRNHPVFTFALAVIIVWLAWNPVMNAFLGGRHTLKNAIEGTWVGEIDIERGYNPALMGNTPGPHRHAVLFFNIAMTDLFMREYGGPGELYIIGEDQPRPIRVGGVQEGPWSGTMYSQPTLSAGLKGWYDPNDARTMHIQGDSNLEFTGTLHQGSKTDYDHLVSQQSIQVESTHKTKAQ